MKKIFLVVVALTSQSLYAADPVRGQTVYNNRCAMCHGATAVNPTPNFPNLAGQKEGYLFQQLKDFKEGRRAGTMMPAMVKDLSDADFADLSSYISSLKTCVSYE